MHIKNYSVHNTPSKYKFELSEENFNDFLPEYLKTRSSRFFTPFHVAQTATDWLTEDGKKCILDIGAGVGKFCIAGAIYSDSFFCGIEHRPGLAKIANELILHFGIQNAAVQQGDIIEVDFDNFDAFYLYNPFFENLIPNLRLNNEVELTASLYVYYFKHTEKQLAKVKTGSRLVTYHGNNFEVPPCFKKVKENNDSLLKLWIKQ